uniref:F-box domain-containing protein n=1 Tax=Strongyloides venezuelensis TaxID=75913 RepID=A0A0K0G322_STRVS
MDSISDEKHSEVQDDLPLLHDSPFLRIFQKLQRKEILNIKLVSRSFNKFIYEKYLLNSRKTSFGDIEYDINSIRCPFHRRRLGKFSSREKKNEIQSDEEFSRCLKVFDTRNLWRLDVYIRGNLVSFVILNRSFQEGTKIGELIILEMEEKSSKSF